MATVRPAGLVIILLVLGWLCWVSMPLLEPPALNPQFAWALTDTGIEAKLAHLPWDHQHSAAGHDMRVAQEITPHLHIGPGEEIFVVTASKPPSSIAHMWVQHYEVRKKQEGRIDDLSPYRRFRKDGGVVGLAMSPTHGRGGNYALAIMICPASPKSRGRRMSGRRYEEPTIGFVEITKPVDPPNKG